MNIANLIVQWVLANLTAWTPWQNRAQINGIDLPGVYLIAELLPPGPAHPFDEETVCIGSTSRPLSERLDQFDATAFRGQGSHGPAERHRENRGAAADSLSVCVLALDLQEPWRSIVPPFLESLLFWAYKERTGDLPFDNRIAITCVSLGKKGIVRRPASLDYYTDICINE